MKPILTNTGYRIAKGKTVIDILPGGNKNYLPTKIEFEGQIYPLKVNLIKAVKAFEDCYSEEQVLEALIKLTTK